MTDEDLIGRLIATARPRTAEVRVCARGDLVDRHVALAEELKALEVEGRKSVATNPDVLRLAEEIRQVEEEQEDSTVTFVVQSVTRRVWADLLAAHPPRPQDKGLDHNEETFPPAVVAACSKSPKMTEEEAVELGDVLPVAEWSKLWLTAVGLNVMPTPHPKLKAATELVLANGASSTTQDPAASPDPSSSDDPAGQ